MPRGFFKWLEEAPPESPLFGSQKWYFPDFPFRGSVGGRPVRKAMIYCKLWSLRSGEIGDREPRTIPTKDSPHQVECLGGGVVCELSEP